MSGADTRDALQPNSPRHDRVTRRILEEEIGRDDVIEALQFATYTDSPDEPPSRMKVLLDLMGDPASAGQTLPTLMKKAGVLLPEVLDVVRRKGFAIALVASGRRVGAVVDGLGEQAEPRWAICSRCMGEGEIEDTTGKPIGDPDEGEEQIKPMMRCLVAHGGCDGSGKIKLSGNLDAAKLFLGVQGLIKSGGGGAPSVVVNTSAQAGVKMDGPTTVKQESVTSRVQNILEGGGD